MRKFIVILSLFLASCASTNKHKEVTHTNIDSISHVVKDSTVSKKEISISSDMIVYGVDEDIEDSVTTTTKDSTGKVTVVKQKITTKRHIDSAKKSEVVKAEADTTHLKTVSDTKLKETKDTKIKTVVKHGLGAGAYVSGTIILLLLIAGYFIAKKLKWI